MILRRTLAAGMGAVLATVTACGLTAPDRSSEFSALVAEVEAMPGVSGVRDTYANGFSQGRDLRLAVLVEDAASVGELAAVSDLVRSRSAHGEFDGFTTRMEFALPVRSSTYSHLSRFKVGWGGWRSGYDDPAACWLELTHLHRGLVVDTISKNADGPMLDVYLATGAPGVAGAAGPDTVTTERAITRCLTVGGPGGGFTIRFRLDGPVLLLTGSAPSPERALDLYRALTFDDRPYVVSEIRMDGDDLSEVTVEAAPGHQVPDGHAVQRELGSEVGSPRVRVTES